MRDEQPDTWCHLLAGLETVATHMLCSTSCSSASTGHVLIQYLAQRMAKTGVHRNCVGVAKYKPRKL